MRWGGTGLGVKVVALSASQLDGSIHCMNIWFSEPQYFLTCEAEIIIPVMVIFKVKPLHLFISPFHVAANSVFQNLVTISNMCRVITAAYGPLV